MITILGGLAFILWGILGFLGVCVSVWWVCQSVADKVPRHLQNLSRRDGWLRYWFGEKGGKLWLANETARRKLSEWFDKEGGCWKASKEKNLAYSRFAKENKVVADPTRSLADYAYSPPWGFDGHPYEPGDGSPPKGCDWLAAGFRHPFTRHGVTIDPMQMVTADMVRGFQSKNGTPLYSPLDDNGRLCRWARIEAMEIEAAGGARAMGIGAGGARRTYWAGSRERLASWIEDGSECKELGC